MNRHRHILLLLVSLFALIDSSPSHKTDDGASTPSSNSFHPRHSIRGLGSNIADLNDEPYPSDNSSGQIEMPLSTPTSITNDDADEEDDAVAPFFGVIDAKAFRVLSYSYDTMPPTVSAQTRLPVPTSDTSTSTSITSTDPMIILNGSMESPPRVPTPAPIPSVTN